MSFFRAGSRAWNGANMAAAADVFFGLSKLSVF